MCHERVFPHALTHPVVLYAGENKARIPGVLWERETSPTAATPITRSPRGKHGKHKKLRTDVSTECFVGDGDSDYSDCTSPKPSTSSPMPPYSR